MPRVHAVKAFIVGIVTLLVFCSLMAQASTKVAFLEQYDEQGKLIQYEPNSRFAHSAIQIGELWLQAYPGEGVKLITWDQLRARGHVVLLEIPVDISFQQVQPYLSKPFDFEYSWSNDAFYCSELLGKLLGIPPEPMYFNHPVWPRRYWDKDGSLGLSPDRVYRYLRGKYSP